MQNINEQIKISGSIGMVKLMRGDNNIFIFHDDHANLKYCNKNNSIFLFEFIENVIMSGKNYTVLLEEPFVSDYSNIKFLWKDTPHIVKFRKFYKKITSNCALDKKKCYAYPIDIRLILTDVSFDELLSNINTPNYFNNYNPSVEQYFMYIDYLFANNTGKTNGLIDEKSLEKYNKNILFIKRVFEIFNTSEYYIKLKYEYDRIYYKYIKPNIKIGIFSFVTEHKNEEYNFVPGFPFENLSFDNDNNNNNFLSQFDKLINGIMEFYAFILLVGLGQKNVILYSGHYHSKNLSYILEKYYGYDITYSVGHIDNLEMYSDDDITNCLNIDKSIF